MTKKRDDRKQSKRKEAEERNARWNELSDKEKIEALQKRRGYSAKQLKKLGVLEVYPY